MKRKVSAPGCDFISTNEARSTCHSPTAPPLASSGITPGECHYKNFGQKGENNAGRRSSHPSVGSKRQSLTSPVLCRLATSKRLATITDEETTWAVTDTLRAWVEKYGIPGALYVDWKTVYLVQATERQKQEGLNPVSQFGNMCGKLGIRLIGANSAQAKGRVERGPGTHQDRLIKKMRPKKFRTYDEVNAFIRDQYLAQYNSKYAVEPREKADYHRSARGLDLNQIFCLEGDRKASQDWVVRYHNRFLQIDKEQKRGVLVRAGSNILVRRHRDGSLTLLLENKPLNWHELAEAPRRVEEPKQKRHVVRPTPAPEHPWRKALRRAAKKP